MHIPEDPQSVEPGKAAATTTLLFIMKSEPRRAREKWALTTHMTDSWICGAGRLSYLFPCQRMCAAGAIPFKKILSDRKSHATRNVNFLDLYCPESNSKHWVTTCFLQLLP